jgi:hypothetical protein
MEGEVLYKEMNVISREAAIEADRNKAVTVTAENIMARIASALEGIAERIENLEDDRNGAFCYCCDAYISKKKSPMWFGHAVCAECDVLTTTDKQALRDNKTAESQADSHRWDVESLAEKIFIAWNQTEHPETGPMTREASFEAAEEFVAYKEQLKKKGTQ